jgi:hypothetical protein
MNLEMMVNNSGILQRPATPQGSILGAPQCRRPARAHSGAACSAHIGNLLDSDQGRRAPSESPIWPQSGSRAGRCQCASDSLAPSRSSPSLSESVSQPLRLASACTLRWSVELRAWLVTRHPGPMRRAREAEKKSNEKYEHLYF